MTVIVYQYDEPPITLEDAHIEDQTGDDISIRNSEGLMVVNIDDVQEIRLVAR